MVKKTTKTLLRAPEEQKIKKETAFDKIQQCTDLILFFLPVLFSFLC